MDKFIKAAVKYLELHGYEILDTNEDSFVNVVCKNDKGISFIHIKDSFNEQSIVNKAEQFEQAAIDYLSHNYVDGELDVSFDIIGINQCSDSEALLRHHINCINS